MSETADDSPSPQQVQLIALTAALVDVPVFAYIGNELFGEPILGAIAGAVVGSGTYFFLRYAMTQGASAGAGPTG